MTEQLRAMADAELTKPLLVHVGEREAAMLAVGNVVAGFVSEARGTIDATNVSSFGS